MEMALLAAIVLIITGAIIFVFLKNRKFSGGGNMAWPYHAKKPLSEPEQILYHRLVAALP